MGLQRAPQRLQRAPLHQGEGTWPPPYGVAVGTPACGRPYPTPAVAEGTACLRGCRGHPGGCRGHRFSKVRGRGLHLMGLQRAPRRAASISHASGCRGHRLFCGVAEGAPAVAEGTAYTMGLQRATRREDDHLVAKIEMGPAGSGPRGGYVADAARGRGVQHFVMLVCEFRKQWKGNPRSRFDRRRGNPCWRVACPWKGKPRSGARFGNLTALVHARGFRFMHLRSPVLICRGM